MDITALTFDERDEFKRKSISEKAISLLQADIDISPMVVDGSWGTGKTEFCHKLINLMRGNDTHHLIYIDAFKADHADEPLMTVLAEVIKVLPDDDSKQSFIKKALPTVRYGLNTIAKAGVSHLLRQDIADVADDFDKEIQKTADKAIDASVKSVFKDHVEAEKNLKALQTALAKIAAIKSIIIFVDELDRCRPNFAVDMLEIIKHTFDVDGVSFVLITNTQQLKASVNHCYGQAVDSQRYLDKFIKFTINLPDKYSQDGHRYNQNAVSLYKNLIQQSAILQDTKLHEDGFLSVIDRLVVMHSISLRETETLVRHLQIYQTLTDNKGLAENIIFGYRLLRLVGVVIYTLDPNLARDFVSKGIDAKRLGEFFNVYSVADLDNGYPDPMQVLAVMLGQESSSNAEMFTPSPDCDTQWEDLIRGYFRRGGFPPNKGSRCNIVCDTINTLSLAR